MATPVDLITKRFRGLTSADEDSLLDTWLAENGENASVYRQAAILWEELGFNDFEFTQDKQMAWDMILGDVKPISDNERKGIWRQMMRLGAIALGLFITAGIVALAIFLNGNQVFTSKHKGERFVLPDNTIAYLDSGTTMKYPKTFGSRGRTITLDGEAMIESPSANKSLVIRSRYGKAVMNGAIADLTFTSKKIEIITISGDVEMQHGGKSYTVGSMMMATVDSSGILAMIPADLNMIAWRTSKIVSDKAPLSRLIYPIEKFLGKKLVFKSYVDFKQPLSASINPATEKSIPDSLASWLGLKYSVTPTSLVFY